MHKPIESDETTNGQQIVVAIHTKNETNLTLLQVSPHVSVEHCQGPLPHPDTLERYNQLLPNAADRIFTIFEEQARARMANEKAMAAETSSVEQVSSSTTPAARLQMMNLNVQRMISIASRVPFAPPVR